MKYQFYFLIAAALCFASCEEESNFGPIPPSGNMVLNLDGLGAPADGFTYEGWIVNGTAFTSTGRFQPDGDGDLGNRTFPVESGLLETADRFIVTLESTASASGQPAGPVLLGGDFDTYEAALSTADAGALGFDPGDGANFAGKYLISAPTSPVAAHDTSGIWFLDNNSGTAVAGLTLPSLPSGWTYEGWVIIGGVPVSTGTFTDPGGPDASCTFCGPLAAPAFPGEDFIQNAPAGLIFPTNLAGMETAVTIEPVPDDSEDPFFLKVLTAVIPGSGTIGIGTVYDMDFADEGGPSGTVKRFYGFDCSSAGCN